MKHCLLPGLLAALSFTAAPAATGVIDAVNAVRASGCGELAPAGAPLRPDARLDEAARRAAAGTELKSAINDAGYRAKRTLRIRIANADGDETRRFLREDFCAHVVDPEFRDIGHYTAGEESWVLFAAPIALAGGADASGAAAALVEAVNRARSEPRQCGGTGGPAAAPLNRNSTLDAVASAHARELAERGELSHEGRDGRSAADRVTDAGYRWQSVAENVAAGQTGAEQVVDTWLASAGHCANLMNARYSDTGVGVAVSDADDRGIYWVQVYAAPQ